MKKCNYKKYDGLSKCNNDAFGNKDLCALHCEKNDYDTDNQSGLIEQFKIELVEYVIQRIDKAKLSKEQLNTAKIKDYLLLPYNDQNPSDEKHFLQNENLNIEGVSFPALESEDSDYYYFLNLFKSIEFTNSTFYNTNFNLGNGKISFSNCIFEELWYIRSIMFTKNSFPVLYNDCEFKGDTVFKEELKSSNIKNNSIFRNCNFYKNLIVTHATIDSQLFSNTRPTKISSLNIISSQFNDRFSLNNCTLDSVNITDSYFNSKFQFKNNTVNNILSIENTDFSKLFDMYKTSAGIFEFKQSILDDFAGFEECKFGKDANKATIFQYVTFMSFTNFRGTIFSSGLDLRNSNLKETPNFLGASICYKNTNRETYRIIKNSFDKIGNIIDANKYFSLEMKKHKDDLKKEPCSQEKIIFRVNACLSNFGQSYIRPLVGLFVSTLIYTILECLYEKNTLYKLFPKYNDCIEKVVNCINNFAYNFIPLQKFLGTNDDMAAINLLFYTVTAVLLWQLIVAVKRHTKRN